MKYLGQSLSYDFNASSCYTSVVHGQGNSYKYAFLKEGKKKPNQKPECERPGLLIKAKELYLSDNSK